MTWILGSVEAQFILNLRPYRTAKEMWLYLKKIYLQENSARRFHLEHEISQFVQGTLSIQDYYSQFTSLWTDYAELIYVDLPAAALASIQGIHQTSQRDQFLMKLRPQFETVRSNLMSRVPSPSLESCLGELLREEQRLVTQTALTQNAPQVTSIDVAYVARGVSETVVLNMSTLVWSVVTTVQGRVPLASEGLSLVVSSNNGEDILVSFGGYNGKYNHEVHVLKPSHKSTLQTKIVKSPVPDSVAAIIPATNVESEFEAVQDGRIREIVMDNADSEPVNIKSGETNERLIAALKADKEEMETALTMEQLQSLQLKQQLAEAETRNTDLTKELQSVRGQLAAEQSRCFKLEVDVAELRQKLQTMDTLQKELELLQRQKAASEQAALLQKQKSSGGVWGWLAGSPPDRTSDA